MDKISTSSPKHLKSLVETTHKPKVKTNDDDDSQYATGWFVTKDNQETLIYHPGTLENYSSYIILNPKKDYGIVVLANAYSSHTPTLAKHLNTQLSQGQHIDTVQYYINQYQTMIIVVTIVIWIMVAITLIYLYRHMTSHQSIPLSFQRKTRNIEYSFFQSALF